MPKSFTENVFKKEVLSICMKMNSGRDASDSKCVCFPSNCKLCSNILLFAICLLEMPSYAMICNNFEGFGKKFTSKILSRIILI